MPTSGYQGEHNTMRITDINCCTQSTEHHFYHNTPVYQYFLTTLQHTVAFLNIIRLVTSYEHQPMKLWRGAARGSEQNCVFHVGPTQDG